MNISEISFKRFNIIRRRKIIPLSLVIKESDYMNIRSHLLREDGLERVSFIFFGIRRESLTKEIYVHKVFNLEDTDYLQQKGDYVLPKIEKLLELFREFSDRGTVGFMHIHSHPFCDNASFSSIDNRSLKGAIRSLKDYLIAGDNKIPFQFGRIVMGQNEAGFSGYIYDRNYELTAEIEDIKVVGLKGMEKIISYRNIKRDKSAIYDKEILVRNIRWLGEEGQKKLSETHLVICGVGGVGSFVALNARGLGLKKITLIDNDRIEKSNLNRLPGATLYDINKYKVEVVKRMIKEVSSHTEVIAINDRVETEVAQNAISMADIVIAGVDSFKARFEIQLLAAKYLKPLIDIGSGINLKTGTSTVKFMGGQIACYIPGGPCLCCQGVVPRDIENELSMEVKRATGYVKDTNITPTSVVTINSIMAGHAVDTMIKYITAFSDIKTYLKCDLLNNSYQIFNFQKREDCLICGNDGIEGKGDEIVEPLFPTIN